MAGSSMISFRSCRSSRRSVRPLRADPLPCQSSAEHQCNDLPRSRPGGHPYARLACWQAGFRRCSCSNSARRPRRRHRCSGSPFSPTRFAPVPLPRACRPRQRRLSVTGRAASSTVLPVSTQQVKQSGQLLPCSGRSARPRPVPTSRRRQLTPSAGPQQAARIGSTHSNPTPSVTASAGSRCYLSRQPTTDPLSALATALTSRSLPSGRWSCRPRVQLVPPAPRTGTGAAGTRRTPRLSSWTRTRPCGQSNLLRRPDARRP